MQMFLFKIENDHQKAGAVQASAFNIHCYDNSTAA